MQPNALRLLINGTVQGVGFRPTVYKVATRMCLSGWVKNVSEGVEVVISATNPDNFLKCLNQSLTQAASIDSINRESYSLKDTNSQFQILPSQSNEINNTQIPVDSRICKECLAELFDSNSRFFLYPFTSCSNCGPRYTLIKNLPYDRANTSMNEFEFCQTCLKEYNDPSLRRYHAETSSCPECGPDFSENLKQVATYVKAGKIVALKAVGGYMLIVDPFNDKAVNRLRERKRRKAKPFALMALNTVSIQHYFAKVNDNETQLLESQASPIVLMDQKLNCLSKGIAPGLNRLGFMLAYNSIFYLLFYYLLGEPESNSWLTKPHELALLVTSANLSGSSIIATDGEALTSLKDIADHIITHNREIMMPCDDSVVMAAHQQNVLIRRGRGYAPTPFYLGNSLPEVLALGGHLKNTICFIRHDKAYLSQYLGEMNNPHSVSYLHKVINHYQKIFGFQPRLVVSDLHPDFYTSQFALSFGLNYLQLQHHHAHLCAVVATEESTGDTLEDNQVLGCILDGYGYGSNGEALGGELILFDKDSLSFNTLSQLPPLTIPGGDISEKQPWRIALAICIDYSLAIPDYLVQQPQAAHLSQLIINKFFPTTTSLGRLFSGIAALLNISLFSDYEAHSILVMESLVTEPCVDLDTICLSKDGAPDCGPLIRKTYQIGVSEANIQQAVNIFYGSLAALLEKWIRTQATLHKIKQIALSGGCWQSQYLLRLIHERFQDSEFELLIPDNLPFGDECISLGQAWYGAMKLKHSNSDFEEKKQCV